MKKLLLVVVGLAVILAVTLVMLHRPEPTPAASAILPATTVALVDIPDFQSCRTKVAASPLNLFWQDPEVQTCLAALTGTKLPVMMLASPELRVVPITVHASLRRMLDMITVERIVAVCRITAAALRGHWKIAAPRLAVAGLNPHAGEDGTMGDEEVAIIAPAIALLRAEGLDVSGPFAADSMFTPAARAGYDVAMGMYHDQALIPLKTLDMSSGVNVTLGLPIVRTSPDHGTAFAIAGQGCADPSSLIAAIDLAAELVVRTEVRP